MKVYNQSVKCLAWMDEMGNIEPLRFKFNDRVYRNVKVQHKTSKKQAGKQMYFFTCVAMYGDQEYICELRYEVSTCIWYLYKI